MNDQDAREAQEWALRRILGERDLNNGERAAIAESPRNGIWWQPKWMPGGPCDRRPLTQEQTDRLIALELRDVYNDGPDGEMTAITAPFQPTGIDLTVVGTDAAFNGRASEVTVARTAHRQRGGIHSDPLIRLFAYRAFGERDRSWFAVIDAIAFAADSARRPRLEAAHQFLTMAHANNSQVAFAEDVVAWFTESAR